MDRSNRRSQSRRPTRTGSVTGTVLGAAAVLLTALAGVGCGGSDDGGWAGTADTLPDGLVRVQNPASGTWTAETRPRLSLTTTIGRATGDERYLFGDVRDLAVDEMGRIWVLDNQNRELRVFSPDGSHVRTFGGTGEGPGEFRDPNGLARDPTTGRMWVIDPATSRYTVFDTAGRLVETRPRDASGYGYVWPGRFDRDGRLFDYMLVSGDGDWRFRGLVVRGADGNARDSLRFSPDAGERSFFRIERENGMAMRAVPFTPYGDWAVSPSGSVWRTEGDPYRLVEIGRDDDTIRIVEQEHEPVPVTEAELDSIRRFYEEQYGQGANQLDFSRIPEQKPAIRALFVARDGRVWVLPYGRQGQTGRIADVFTPKGHYLGRLELPVRLRWSISPVVTEEALYGVREDPATGVHQVVRIAIEEPGS